MKVNTRLFRNTLLAFAAFVSLNLAAQENFETWWLQGPDKSYPNGTRTEDWYAKSPDGKSRTIVVAVMDSGIDLDHPDLAGNLWVNPGEVPSNGKDDDGNGYIDDVHGWNFIGGKDGRSVIKESLEVTRVYAREKEKWANVDGSKLTGKKRKQYEEFTAMQAMIESEIESASAELQQVLEIEKVIKTSLTAAKAELKGDPVDVERLESSENEDVMKAGKIIRSVQEQGLEVTNLDSLLMILEEQFAMQKESALKTIDYQYNTEFDSRKIVGDTYTDFDNRIYGNNNVDGDFAFHGTHVSGIIGAVRHNDTGIKGIADNVVIMSIKCVPDGDERDKDVANGIYYAVDNGASVINMSFGKGYSPEKFLVDEALKYAAKHDVLIVHGAGNEGTNKDEKNNFPNDTYLKKGLFGPKRAPNFLSVGALSPEGGDYTLAEFSNYGKTEVDVFAPGVYIYSTIPGGEYEYASGTSMAAPVVTGMAALIRSRYPALTAPQVKQILMQSTRPLPDMVIAPGTFTPISGKDACVSGGMVDMVKAMELAAVTKGKKSASSGHKTTKGSGAEYVRPAGKA